MRKIMDSQQFRLTRNQEFGRVIESCANIGRKGQDGTWITTYMKNAYLKLHELGHATSYEVWSGDKLVGGLYGVDLGHVFCGESMFSLESNASKFALISLAQELSEKGYKMIDCQLKTDHLISMGAEEISRENYLRILET